MEEKNAKLINDTLIHMNGIVVYRKILKDAIFKKYSELINMLRSYSEAKNPVSAEQILNCYCEVFSMLIERYAGDEHLTGDMWKNHLIQLVISDENTFSIACENAKVSSLSDRLLNIVKMDLNRIYSLFNLDGHILQQIVKTILSVEALPAWELKPYDSTTSNLYLNYRNSEVSLDDMDINRDMETDISNLLYSSQNWDTVTDALVKHYHQHGCGEFCKYKAFRWVQTESKGLLAGIDKPDPIQLTELIGYERERSVVIKNTLQFIHGLPCNNVLLYGDRGTGKSATVKAILNKYANSRLRLIEVSKYHLKNLPDILELLQNRGLKFIIFIDDLSFESDETSYRELKSILEGGIEAKPQNVVIYATSNRRHLIKEYFSERSLNDEVSSQDTMQEKLSLSDRFGITVTFSMPDKKTYLQIVEGIAKQRGINIDYERLKSEAVKWEMLYNGRSPRTARQFVDHLEGELMLAGSHHQEQ
jgi:predicted AAA+ superfamily ATPase